MCNMEGGIFTVIFHANITSLFNCDYLIKLKLKKTQSIITIRSKNIQFLRCFLTFCQPQNLPHCQQGNLAKFVAAPNCPTAAISPWVDDFMRHTPPDNRRGASPFANPPPLVFKGDSGCFYFFSYILRNPFSHDELTKVQFFLQFSPQLHLEICGVKFSRVDWGYALMWVPQSSLHTWFWHSVSAGSVPYNLERTLAGVSPFTLNVPLSLLETLLLRH